MPVQPAAQTSEIQSLQRLLESRRPHLRFSPDLEAAFQQYLKERFLNLLDQLQPALLLFYLAVGVSTWLAVRALSAPVHLAGNLRVWWTIYLVEGLVLLGMVLLARWPWLQRRFRSCTAALAVAALAAITIGTAAFPDPYFNQHSSYVVIFILAIVSVIGVFRLRTAFLVFTTAALLSWGVIRAAGLWLDVGLFLQYVLLANIVGLLLCHMVEQRDRRVFLQARLIGLEKDHLGLLSDELERLSREDVLTGLANRRHFNETLQAEWERARRDSAPLALLFVDIDHFKAFNDTYGHLEADNVLSHIGAALRSCLRRPGDLAARYGGEEFVLVLPGTPATGALEVARQVQQALAALAIPHHASSVADLVTASIGVAACVPARDLPATHLLNAADAAAYAAKAAGRNCIRLAPAEPLLAPA